MGKHLDRWFVFRWALSYIFLHYGCKDTDKYHTVHVERNEIPGGNRIWHICVGTGGLNAQWSRNYSSKQHCITNPRLQSGGLRAKICQHSNSMIR